MNTALDSFVCIGFLFDLCVCVFINIYILKEMAKTTYNKITTTTE